MQLTLFPPARRNHPTQQAAARHVAPHTPSMREKVSAYVLSRGWDGATNEEIATALDMRLSSVCGRVNELKRLGELAFSGQQRKGTSGINALVWRHKSAPNPVATLEGTLTGFTDSVGPWHGTMSINGTTLQIECPHPPFSDSNIGKQVQVQTKSGRVIQIQWPLSTVAMGMKGEDASGLD